MNSLPYEFGLPDLDQVHEENPHGTNWRLVRAYDQGANTDWRDRYLVTFKSAEGYEADYFYEIMPNTHVIGWMLGAN